MNKKSKRLLCTAVVAMGLATTAMIPQLQAAPSKITSYFLNELDATVDVNHSVTKGVKKAVSEGLSIPMKQKIMDQDITINLKEMYVDDGKVLIHYTITQKDGTLVPYEFDTTGLKIQSDGKKDGKQVEEPTVQGPKGKGSSRLNFFGTDDKEELPFYLVDEKGKALDAAIAAEGNLPEGMMSIQKFQKSNKSKPIYLHLKINRIGKTKGKWEGKILIDQSKAEQATKISQEGK